MSIPSTGPISLDDIQKEFGGPAAPISLDDYYRGGKYVNAALTAIPASGPISLDDFRGAQNSTNGTMRWDAPGTYTWTCPVYLKMYAEAVGGSGGPGSSVRDIDSVVLSGVNGSNGENSMFGDFMIIGGGGGGGGGGQGARHLKQCNNGVLGPPGGASGGDTNTFGAGLPGGQGIGWVGYPKGVGGQGGSSGKATINWKLGDAVIPNQRGAAPVPGQTYTVIIGDGGASGSIGPGTEGSKGSPGYVYLKWE